MILNSLSIKKLKKICKENNYKGYSKLNKKDLILFINNKKTKDFKLNSLFDLIKYIKSGITIDNLINNYNNNYSKKGYLYEKLWDILIKTGYSFSNLNYEHMDGNINLGYMNKINNLEKYFNTTNIFSKNKGGSSDITLKNKNGTWIFISSKYYNDDSKKSIKDYEIQDILKEINEYRHYYTKYEIWLVVNCKSKVNKVIQSCQNTNKTIVNNIINILDYNDLKNMYLQFQSDIQNINLNLKGYFNNVFNSSKDKLVLRFHQDLFTTKTITQIKNSEKNILWGWKCRAGKTYGVGGLLIKYLNTFNKCNCLIITPAPSETLSQFVDDMFNKFRDFNNFEILDIKNGKKLKSIKLSKNNNNIIITSKQLLDDYISNDNKIIELVNINLDLIIFDENHFGGCSKLSDRIISTYSNKNTVKVFLTATFQKPLNKWNIPSQCQYYWNIEDEQFCKKRNIQAIIHKHGNDVTNFINDDNIDSKLKIYDNMPNIELITTMMDQERYEIIKKQINDTKFGFSMDVLFSLSNGNYFNYPKEVENIISYISGSSTGYLKDNMSIFERIKKISNNYNSRTKLCNENFTTQLWFLPFGHGMKINDVSKCLKSKILNDVILKHFDVMIINSHKEYKLKDLKNQINIRETKAKSEGKIGLILLAGNQCSLGITLPLCDIVVLLNNTLSSDRIMQMMYRCMSESNSGDKKCGFVVDLNISRVLNTLLEYNISKSNKTIKNKLEYLIENNLINIDSDLFIGSEKKNSYGIKLVDKLLNIWKSDPINHHKQLLKKIENLIIDLEDGDQNILNKYFTKNTNDNQSIIIKFDENNDQNLQKGKKCDIINNDNLNNTDSDCSDDSDIDDTIKISLTKDVLPFVIPLSCILTINDNQMDFIKMLDNIKNNKFLLDIFDEQSYIWWNKKDIIKLISNIVKKYIYKNTEPYNIAIHFKMSLQSLIDKPNELLDLINKCLKPKIVEKKKHGEVFTPMNTVNDMLDKLNEFHLSKYKRSIFEEKTYKWFDPANGMGNFPIALYYKLMDGLNNIIKDDDKRKKHILENMIYMSELNKKNVFITKQIFDIDNTYNLNLYYGDSLKLDIQNEWNIEKFNVIFGNPPYNKELKRSGATAYYNEFVDKYIDICDYQTFIIPSRWFAGGKGLDKFRKNMLKRTDIPYITHFDNASDIFGNNVDIKGGVNYYLKSNNYNGDCIYNGNKIKLNTFDILIDSKFYSLVHKLIKYPSINKLYNGRYFGIESNDKRLTKDLSDNSLKCYVSKQKGFIKYIDSKYLKKDYKFWKVITAEASYKGNSGFGNIFIGELDDVHSGSYISFQVSNESEAKSLMSYLSCKLPNLMLSLRKISQHINKNVCKWIPLPPLDKIWSDSEIFKFYNLNKDDITLIKNINIVGYKDKK